ncbi:MAG: hypothetical protein QMD07_01855 [Thermodesulfovibrionales bacterium]|nr:hypothetical protein [Thermodesulfovibrionales bacterium]
MKGNKEQDANNNNGVRFVWPDLIYKEFVAMIVVTLVLIGVSFLWDAPLREIANPGKTENPAKAPWYFLGLQELLVYFDPWIAGVVLPSIIIVGLMVMPYLDRNPVGGQYGFSRRKFAMINYLFGFALWFILIFIGTYLRGPNWQFYWLWESWEVEKHLEEKLWSFSPFAGAAFIGAYFSIGMIIPVLIKKGIVKYHGVVRYIIVMTLMLGMYFVPIKIVLRLFFNVRYVLETPWFNI